MNEMISVTEKDELIMRLVHYFVTKENYAPIMVNGVKNEIWLENLDAYYRIIRINSNYIHNKEQMEFDQYKILNVNKQISKKTLSRKLKTLNILTDTNDELKIESLNNIDNFIVKSYKDLKNKNGLISIFPQINNEDIKDLHGLDFLLNVSNDINKKTEKDNRFYENVFKPKKIVITKFLIVINVLVFILSYLLTNMNVYDVYTNFALNKFYVKNGDLFRLVSGAFLHADFIHLLCNMYSLNVIGTQIENFLGKKKFIVIYFISMISGSLLSCILNTGWSVGASGAIFGLFGSLIYFGYYYRLYLGSILKNQLIPILIINLAIGLLPGIDMAGHIGGLVGGILSTMALGIENKTKKGDRINGTICLVLFMIFTLFLLFKG